MRSPLSRLRAFPLRGTLLAAGRSPLRGRTGVACSAASGMGGDGWSFFESAPRSRASAFQDLNLSFPARGKTNYSKAERSNGPSESPHPSGRAEERRVRGGQEHCKMLLLRELACGSCLNVESEVNEESSAAPRLDRAPQVARSVAQGHGKWGRLSFAYVSLAKQRKVGALPGAIPGLRPKEKRRRPLATAALNQPPLALTPQPAAAPALSQRERESIPSPQPSQRERGLTPSSSGPVAPWTTE